MGRHRRHPEGAGLPQYRARAVRLIRLRRRPDGVFGLSGLPFIPLGVGWRYAYPTYGSRHGELKIPMPGVGSRLTRPAFGDLSILLKIPAIKRGFLALTRRVK
ncbi:conserved hypothetical protein [Klebsiella quasipneumoniae subsp. similipneumoniae]|nr:conserved hypothetical protein [Klebsiella quasipneumoniae subsp. similipneumoniae]